MTTDTPAPTDRRDRFVFVPLRLRRDHRDWSNAEHAAWFDLFLASFEVEGRFDSIDVARAYLGPREAALDALISRGAFVELDGTWSLTDYLELYDGRRPRHYKTLAQRLADADAKQARGEPLEPIERWARWKDRQNAKRSEPESEKGKGSKEGERDTANVDPTLANADRLPDPNDCPDCETGTLVLKEGKRGQFLSCDQYPACQYSRDIRPRHGAPLVDLDSPANRKLRGAA